jgi:hypothetical protein
VNDHQYCLKVSPRRPVSFYFVSFLLTFNFIDAAVVRQLAALPVPPRSTIIERTPAAPARPRDIIIERWVPYGAAAKRRTVVQRAGAAQQYQAPRNTIIQYEAVQVRITRQFQNLGVQPENPQAYVQRYGAQLLDSVTLVHQARAAGVVEDIVSFLLILLLY